MDDAWKARMAALFGEACARCGADVALDYLPAKSAASTVRGMWSLVPLCGACRTAVDKAKAPRFEATGHGVRTLLLVAAARMYAEHAPAW
jgi:hypothetical protein